MLDSAESAEPAEEARERSLGDDIRRLAEDARALAAAEIAYQKSRAAYAGHEAKNIAVLGLLAVLFAFFALMALTVGLVIALTPVLTAWGATGAVFGALLLIAALCAWSAGSRWARMTRALSEEAER